MKPYPFQVVGSDTIIESQRLILADGMGLGKTIQVILAFLRAGCTRSLFITKKHLRKNLYQELLLHYPKEDINLVDHSNKEKRRVAIGDTTKRVTILSYEDATSTLLSTVLQYQWDSVAVDEAHSFKGRATKRSLGLKAIAKLPSIQYLVLMTGYPILNNADDLFNLLQTLYPKKFPSYWKWVETYFTKLKVYGPGGMEILKVGPPKNYETFRTSIAPYVLRRDWEEASPELISSSGLPEVPDLVPEWIPIELDALTKSVYTDLEQRYQTEFNQGKLVTVSNHLDLLMKLRLLLIDPYALTPDDRDPDYIPPKAKYLLELIGMFPGTKWLCFTTYREPAYSYAQILRNHGIPCLSVSGDTSRTPDVEAVVKEWENSTGTRVLIGTYGVLSEGHNLQRTCSRVPILDLPYRPSDVAQAVKRVHRIGQSNPVWSPILYTEGTVEEKIRAMLSSKEDIFTRSIPLSSLF